MPTATKILFLVVALGLVTPALWNVLKATHSDRRYDRNRNRKIKPVGERRYRNLWIVDRETDDDEAHR